LAGSGQAGFNNGSAFSANFNQPTDVAVDRKGNVYVCDFGNHAIRKISTDGTVSTLAGNGKIGSRDDKGDSATFNMPIGIAFDKSSGNLIVSDYGSHIIRKISPDGLVTTISGTPNISGFLDGISPLYDHPCGIAVGKAGQIYIADRNNNAIRQLFSDGSVSTYCGSRERDSLIDGRRSLAGFLHPVDIAIDFKENLYVVENSDSSGKNFRYHIRKIDTKKNRVSLYAGNRKTRGSEDGVGEKAAFNGIAGITYISALKSFFVADAANHTVRQVKQSRWEYDPAAIVDSIFIPTAFTPNGDDNNDRWGVKSRFVDSLAYTTLVEVYNQWGQKVFYARNKREEWDGKTGDAENPTGSYKYVVSVWYEDKYATVHGQVNLIR
jgi:gliding motility-associated-like protein